MPRGTRLSEDIAPCNMQPKSFKMSRRTFLKGSALTVGALSTGPLSFRNWATTSSEAPLTRVPTICNGCGNRCALFASVKNERIWKIEGNREANGNQGALCPKGHGYLHDLYNPNRIRSPLKRVDGKFRAHLVGTGLQGDRAKDQPHPAG